MSLHDEIQKQINQGRLQREWTTSDLLSNRELARKYAETTLRTDPPNRSISARGMGYGDGFTVRSGATPIFVRVSKRGRALLYSLLKTEN